MSEHVYLILGCQSSGRRFAVYDLVKDLASETDPFTLHLQESEKPNEWAEKLAELDHVTLEPYTGEVSDIQASNINPQHTNLVVAPGLSNPVDQVEAFKTLVEHSSCDLGRVITVVHCDQLTKHPKLLSWYDACIHFSDACIIHRSMETSNQAVQDFIDRYKDKQFPILFETVFKKGIKNPGLILDPEARRISLFFEPEEDAWLDDEDDDAWDGPEEDPYMVRIASGSREKWVPDIESILKGSGNQ